MALKINSTDLPEVLILEDQLFHDKRGFFFESFNKKKFNNETNLKLDFVQDNHSKSSKNVLRGLHYQIKRPQGKLIRVIQGEIFDVVLDIRKGSENFGKWVGVNISEEKRNQLWVPPGFAHGFLVLSDTAEIIYKTTDYWYPEYERTILYNDPEININWPIDKPILSDKDKSGLPLRNSEVYKL